MKEPSRRVLDVVEADWELIVAANVHDLELAALQQVEDAQEHRAAQLAKVEQQRATAIQAHRVSARGPEIRRGHPQ